MNKLEELKKLYESTEIPAELAQRINQGFVQGARPHEDSAPTEEINEHLKMSIKTKGDLIMNTENKKEGNAVKETKNSGNGRHRRLYRGLVAGAAAFAVLFGAFGVGVSTNQAFAASMSEVPLLSNLVRVFTGTQVDEMDNVAHVEMSLPKVEGLTDKAIEDRINQEIQTKMTAVVEEAKARAIENKKAWLATGGKEEEYLIFDIIVDYEVKAISDDVLSFLVSKTETSASAYFEQYYYNIDLHTNKDLTLEGMLGEDYKAIVNASVAEQIAVRSQNPDNVFFDGADGMDGFTSIADDQNFYVNKAGTPVVVFNKYEIAPGFMGMQEFEITK